jgi:2'-5' RNA ligase
MPKARLGVALLVPPPLSYEVDGLRRALGDGSLGRIPAHLTLVPPVNVNRERLGEALGVLRKAAGATRPFAIATGAPETFLPDNPVLYLPLQQGAPEITAVRNRVFEEPLARPLTWPFVPHITLADEAEPARIGAAIAALADYRLDATFDRIHLLEEGKGRVWRPIADCAFEAPRIVGRGGLETELSVTTILDPEAAVLLDDGLCDIVITARREGRVLGVLTGSSGEVRAVVATPDVADEGIEDHLLAEFRSRSAR